MSAAARGCLVAFLVFASGVAMSQSIYRCGHTYSTVPCPNAKTIALDGSSPTAANRAEARQVAQRERRLADEMARDRRRAEAAQQPAMATSLGPTRVAEAPVKPKAAKKPAKKKRKAAPDDEPRDFVATVPRVRKTPG